MTIPHSWPQVALELTTLAAAVAFWAGLRQVLNHDYSLVGYGLTVVFFTLWVSGLALVSLFVKSGRQFYGLSALAMFSFLPFFGLPAALVSAGVLLIIVLAYAFGNAVIGRRWMRDDAATRIMPRYFHTLQVGLPRFVSPLLLFIAALFYLFTPTGVSDRLIDFNIPRPIFDAVAAPLQGVLMSGSLGQALGPGALNPLTDRQFNDELYATVSKTLKDMVQPYKTQFKILIAVGLFFTLRAIASPYTALLIEFILLLFNGLVKLRIIEKHTVQREQVTYQFK